MRSGKPGDGDHGTSPGDRPRAEFEQGIQRGALVLRIHFTAEDIGRVRVAANPDPMWEIALSIHQLQGRQGALPFDEWRGRTRPRLGREYKALLSLFPARGYFPDFLTPAEGTGGLEEGMDALLSTPRTRLGADIERLAAGRPAPSWMRLLCDGDPGMLRRVTSALRGYHEAALAPHWHLIQAHVDADRAVRARALLEGGTERLLAGLGTSMRWLPPVLEVDYPVDKDLLLQGRGLVLVPSFFCWRVPIGLADPGLSPVLVYPIERTAGWLTRGESRSHGGSAGCLAKLLGQTRSTVLEAVDVGCTTTELARKVGVSPASASQHASVLRESGLITSLRRGSAVFHTLTPLGTALVNGRPGAPVGERAPGGAVGDRPAPPARGRPVPAGRGAGAGAGSRGRDLPVSGPHPHGLPVSGPGTPGPAVPGPSVHGAPVPGPPVTGAALTGTTLSGVTATEVPGHAPPPAGGALPVAGGTGAGQGGPARVSRAGALARAHAAATSRSRGEGCVEAAAGTLAQPGSAAPAQAPPDGRVCGGAAPGAGQPATRAAYAGTRAEPSARHAQVRTPNRCLRSGGAMKAPAPTEPGRPRESVYVPWNGARVQSVCTEPCRSRKPAT